MSEYSKIEERINVYSHLLGVIFGVVAFILLLIKSMSGYDLKSQISFLIFGISLILLYAASTMYHNAVEPEIRRRRKVIDHAAIYILIAGSYTPYALAALGGVLGWSIFGVSWLMAIAGIVLKIFFTGQFKLLSTLLYILMGWMIVIFIKPLMLVISEAGFYWLLFGGISYSVGAIFYSIKRIKLNHGIFHIFVLVGSVCHFISIYCYI